MCVVSRPCLYKYQRTQKELLSCRTLTSHQRTQKELLSCRTLTSHQRTQKELLSCRTLTSHQRTCRTRKNPGVGLHDRLHQFQSQTTISQISQIKRWFSSGRSTVNIKHHQLKNKIKNHQQQQILNITALGVYLDTYLHFTCQQPDFFPPPRQVFFGVFNNLKQECLLAF